VAVVQISKIQVRRGQKNQGTGLPQLASGEIGWAIDTQELFIGNGSVAEGAPQVGNTKVITEHDDLFTLADSYVYRDGSGAIQTGADSSNPVVRTLQARLDDTVSVRSFGVTGEQSQDCTVRLQRAIDQLFLNGGSPSVEQNRVVLNMEPGIYTVSGTIYIPPYATIVGAGEDKTIIRQTAANAPVFQTVNDTSTEGSPASDASSEFANQARGISIINMTLRNEGAGSSMVLQSCRDSHFKHVAFEGAWEHGDSINEDTTVETSIGIVLNSKNGGVETSGNEFIHCEVKNFAYGIVSEWDINDNVFQICKLSDLGYGVSFGKSMTLDGDIGNGTAYGPKNNIISESVFRDVDRQAIYIKHGTYNVSRNNKFISCGNDGGSDDQPVYSIIRFGYQNDDDQTIGNESVGDYFSRTEVLAYSPTVMDGAGKVAYIPEVEGPSTYQWGFEHELAILSGNAIKLMRLPNVSNPGFRIEYTIISPQTNAMRTGTLTIMSNNVTSGADDTPRAEVSDEYHYVGTSNELDSISFDAILDDIDQDGSRETLVLRTWSNMPQTDTSRFKFKVETRQTTIS
jgi:hypothetical protein